TRQGAGYNFAANYSWSPGYLLTLLVPNFFGEPGKIGYWGNGIYEESIFYTGILPLLLILALTFRKNLRRRLIPFLLALGGAGLLLALGQFGILHRLAYNFLPFFRSMRAPGRAGFLFTFAVAALSGLLLTWLRQNGTEARRTLRRWTRGPLPWMVVSITALVVIAGFFLFALQRDTDSQVGRLWHVANNSALFLLFFLLSIGLLRLWGTGRLTARQGTLLALVLVLLDLWGFGRSIIRPAEVEKSAYWRIVAEIVNDGEGRVLPWGLSVFDQNKGMALGLESVFGYDPLELERYSRFITQVPDPRSRAYDLLHARYLVTTQEMDFADDENAPQLIGQRDGVWVYERPTALPAAWLIHQVEVRADESTLERLNEPDFDPRSTALLEREPACPLSDPAQPEEVRFSRQGNNQIAVEVRADSVGLLMLSEIYYPGWRATLDGEPVPILRADYVLRALCVPAGEHRVVMVYDPPLFKIGLAITGLTLLLIVAAAIWATRRRGDTA
ncbi:MAG: YfhO family protein, partial [Chloroflexota bacterium]|nr:YfhO family protein [Chloroflexota bacterium]